MAIVATESRTATPSASTAKTTELSEELILAVERDDLKAVQELLALGANINYYWSEKSKLRPTALLVSVRWGHTQMVEFLIQHGANIHQETVESGLTALQVAAAHGYLKILEVLLQKGADIHHTDKLGNTPLLEAAFNGQTEIVDYLLHHGSKITDKNVYGTTALLAIASRGHHQMIEILLLNGAKVDEKNACGSTALILAIEHGHTNTVRAFLRNGATFNIKDERGISAFFLAIGFGHIAIVELLLNHGADINELNEKGYTPLSMAAMYDQYETVEFLLSRKANISQCNNEGFTALHWAAMYGKLKSIEVLLKRGAKINNLDKYLRTPLSCAATYGQTHLIDLLVQAGANINARNLDNDTPLLLATRYGHTQTVERLLINGANICDQTPSGANSLMLAVKKGFTKTVKLLLNKGAILDQAAFELKESLETATLEMLASLKQFRMAEKLFDAVKTKNDSLMDELLSELGYAVNARLQKYKGETALHLAVRDQNIPVIVQLLEAGADANIMSSENIKAIDLMFANENPYIQSLGHLLKLKELLSSLHKMEQSESGSFTMTKASLSLESDEIKEREETRIAGKSDKEDPKESKTSTEIKEIKESHEAEALGEQNKEKAISDIKAIIEKIIQLIRLQHWGISLGNREVSYFAYQIGLLFAGIVDDSKPFDSLAPIDAVKAYNMLNLPYIELDIDAKKRSIIQTILFMLLFEKHVRYVIPGKNPNTDPFFAVCAADSLDDPEENYLLQARNEHLLLSGPENPHKFVSIQLLSEYYFPENGITPVATEFNGFKDLASVRAFNAMLRRHTPSAPRTETILPPKENILSAPVQEQILCLRRRFRLLAESMAQRSMSHPAFLCKQDAGRSSFAPSFSASKPSPASKQSLVTRKKFKND